MAGGTLTYEYGPNDQVWVIYNQATLQSSMTSRAGCPPSLDGIGVSEGKVVYYKGTVLVTGTQELYGILLTGTQTTRDFAIADVFGSLSEALVEYERRVSGGGVSP